MRTCFPSSYIPIFLLPSHVGRDKAAPGLCFIRALIPFLRALPSGPNHHSQFHLQMPTHYRLDYNIWTCGGKQTFSLWQQDCAPFLFLDYFVSFRGWIIVNSLLSFTSIVSARNQTQMGLAKKLTGKWDQWLQAWLVQGSNADIRTHFLSSTGLALLCCSRSWFPTAPGSLFLVAGWSQHG